jgi:hypothetical protein
MLEIYCIAEQVLISQEGLSSMKLVIYTLEQLF